MAILTAVAFVSAAFFGGGWPWALLTLLFLLLLLLLRADFTVASIFATLGVGIFWLAAYLWTGDRRLFFPFSMQLAVQALYLGFPRGAGGAAIVLSFLLIRIAQAATTEVLVVEALIAAAILPLVRQISGSSVRETRPRLIAGATGSLAALASLLI